MMMPYRHQYGYEQAESKTKSTNVKICNHKENAELCFYLFCFAFCHGAFCSHVCLHLNLVSYSAFYSRTACDEEVLSSQAGFLVKRCLAVGRCHFLRAL